MLRLLTRLVSGLGTHTSWYSRDRARCLATQVPSRLISHDTEIDAAITAAVQTAGLQAGSVGQQQELCEHLKQNWYSTAGDVASMSKEEVQRMRLPVKLWTTIKAMVAGDVRAAAAADRNPSSAQAAADAEMDMHLEEVSAAADALQALATSAGQQLVQQASLQQQQQHPAAGSSGGSHQVQQATAQQTSSLQSAAAAAEPLPADIMLRRMPQNYVGSVRMRTNYVRVRPERPSMEPYSLKDAEMSAALQAEFQKLQQFSCGTFYGQRVEPLRPVSFAAYKAELRQVLGFAHRVRGVPLDQLSLSTLLPSAGREGVSLIMDYQHWQRARGLSPRSLVTAIKAAIVLARYLFHDQSTPEARPPYRDLEVVQELANMMRAASREAAGAPPVSDTSKQWLDWDEYLGLVHALRAECAGLTAAGKPRVRSEVASSLQRYLIAAILSVIPDRQRTLRELEVGRTLLQREDRSWVIKHGPGDYKTGKKYGDRPPLVIAPFIYPELEAFINTWRKELHPRTNRLFVKPRSGEPMDDKSLCDTFQKAAKRLTGKATHPHLVRDIIVTHLRNQGTSEMEMESLALLMGHSLAEQRNTYDRRTKAQKVTPAVELMLELSQGLGS